MKPVNNYKWNGHNINIQTNASPKFLWLNHKLDIQVDNTLTTYQKKRSLTRSLTSFHLKHNGRNLKGQIISAGFPCTPIISLLTIVDDTIIGHSHIFVGSRIFTYLLISATILGINFL